MSSNLNSSTELRTGGGIAVELALYKKHLTRDLNNLATRVPKGWLNYEYNEWQIEADDLAILDLDFALNKLHLNFELDVQIQKLSGRLRPQISGRPLISSVLALSVSEEGELHLHLEFSKITWVRGPKIKSGRLSAPIKVFLGLIQPKIKRVIASFLQDKGNSWIRHWSLSSNLFPLFPRNIDLPEGMQGFISYGIDHIDVSPVKPHPETIETVLRSPVNCLVELSETDLFSEKFLRFLCHKSIEPLTEFTVFLRLELDHLKKVIYSSVVDKEFSVGPVSFKVEQVDVFVEANRLKIVLGLADLDSQLILVGLPVIDETRTSIIIADLTADIEAGSFVLKTLGRFATSGIEDKLTDVLRLDLNDFMNKLLTEAVFPLNKSLQKINCSLQYKDLRVFGKDLVVHPGFCALKATFRTNLRLANF